MAQNDTPDYRDGDTPFTPEDDNQDVFTSASPGLPEENMDESDDISRIINTAEEYNDTYDEESAQDMPTPETPQENSPLTEGAWWNEDSVQDSYEYSPYDTRDIVAPDMDTSYPTYDPTQENYSPDLSYEDHTVGDDGWTTLQKVILSTIAVLSALLLIWLGWWILDGKDKGIVVPWENTSTSTLRQGTDPETNPKFDADSVLSSRNNTTSGSTTSATSSTSSSGSPSRTMSSNDRNDLAKQEKLSEDLTRENAKLKEDVRNLKRDVSRAKTTITKTGTSTVTEPPRTITRTFTPPPREIRVTAPPVTNTITKPAVTVTNTMTVTKTNTVHTTVEKWIQ